MFDFISIPLLAQGFNAGLKIAELTGFIESLNVKIDKLINTDLNSGIRDLQSSERTDNIESKILYIYEARKCFRNAISLEKDERLCLAYIGYIYCLGCMNERENMRVALEDFSCKHFQVNFWGYKTFKEEFVEIFVSSVQYLPFKLKNYKLFAEDCILLAKLCLLLFLLFIRQFNPQYLRLRMRYTRKKNVETFKELQNRIKFFQQRKIVQEQIILIAEKFQTKQAKYTIKDSRKILMLIEKQMQIFDLQKEAYNYANQL
ncbi:hypothetical protein AFK68_07115 [Hydrocoleum sp. CS-953]|uniref:hypothetical protein n=1 Tax=Hydrocoleum sp. CS-953 TaxID=1671698 RepID=UPI000B9BACD6|nr:hypothetical protein [Hydrocoleum sp. CS-953]OZH55034.1 hypothetical protein AFK68_07115 [Hydrocoleum sp. CS-953]